MEIQGREYDWTIPGPWKSLREVRDANYKRGDHWFSASTMEFFDSQVETGVSLIAGRFFVTSEQDKDGAYDGRRRFTVRAAADDGSIETVGEFMGYSTLDEAVEAAKSFTDSPFLTELSTSNILYQMRVRAGEAARGIDVRANERAIRWGFEELDRRGVFKGRTY